MKASVADWGGVMSVIAANRGSNKWFAFSRAMDGRVMCCDVII